MLTLPGAGLQRSPARRGGVFCCRALAWSALGGGDRVGGLVFNETGHREIRPRRSRKTVLTLLSQIAEYSAALPLNAEVEIEMIAS